MTFPLQALIFHDKGVNEQSVLALEHQLKEILDPKVVINKVDAKYLATQAWEERTVVLVMGAGICSEWDILLGEMGIRKIEQYVRKGGKFIGLCAGAYFVSAESRFEIPNQKAIEKKRSLRFFDGKAIGPLVHAEDYLSSLAARAAEVCFKIQDHLENGSLYYQGGCYFSIDHDTKHTQILARYRHLAYLRAAAIKCKVGKGAAFLCGLHPEFSWPKKLKESGDHALTKLAKLLCDQESFRKRIWKLIGKTLKLPLRS